MSEVNGVILPVPGEAEAGSKEVQLAKQEPGLRCAEGTPGPSPI